MNQDPRALLETIRRDPGRSLRACARLMSLLENAPERIPELYVGMGTWPEPALVLGLTGAPGVGKSSVLDVLIATLRRLHPQRRIGVLAVDPSSPFTGGAVLGDRVRMMRHATDQQVFIRSCASRGHLGGLSLGVRAQQRVLGLLGCDIVILETVGVGQSEVEVAQVADLVAVVLAPGQGDTIQLLKAGLMEAGDLFLINKSDRQGADQLYAQVLTSLTMAGPHPAGDPISRVHRISAKQGDGVEALVAHLEERRTLNTPDWQQRRRDSVIEEVRLAVLEHASRRLAAELGQQAPLRAQLSNVLAGRHSVVDLAQQLLETATKRGPQP